MVVQLNSATQAIPIGKQSQMAQKAREETSDLKAMEKRIIVLLYRTKNESDQMKIF